MKPPLSTNQRPQWDQFRRWGLIVAEYGAVQIMVQLLMGVAGILIIRSMSKPEYALFAIANSMSTTCNLLADLGIGMGIRSIGGRVYDNPRQFGELLQTALGLRRRFAVWSLSVCLPIAAWMLWRNGATTFYSVALCIVLAIGVIPLLSASVWTIAPSLHGEYRRFQKLELGNAILRLLIITALALSRIINALLASLVAVVTNIVQAIVLRRWAHEKVEANAPPNPDYRKELIRLSKKSLPNTVFFCFQGQITLFILTLVGTSTGIADLTALGRLAVLFAVLASIVGTVLIPRFTRCQDAKRLPRIYLILVGGTLLVLVPLVVLVWQAPELFLWILGSKYAALGRECVWVVLAACISQVGGTMWHLNSSKAWIAVQSRLFIPAMVIAQVILAISLDLRQFHNVILFNVVISAVPLPIYVADALIGLRRAQQQGVNDPNTHG